MGTTFRLTFFASSATQADQVAALVFERINYLNLIFSDYLTTSEINGLADKAGQKVKVSDDLWHLIKVSKKVSKRSKGAFDVTVGPLTKLWRHAIRQQQFPDSTRLNQALQLVNYRWIKLYPATQSIKLKKPGMKLDFGAIAKGYAVDQAYQVLKKQGIPIALVDGGGDLFVGDPPPQPQTWSIKDHKGRHIKVPAHSAVASSGDSYKFLSWNGKRYSHIVDPGTAIGIEESEIVTVTAQSATIADALASTCSILTEKHRKKLLKKYRARLLKP